MMKWLFLSIGISSILGCQSLLFDASEARKFNLDNENSRIVPYSEDSSSESDNEEPFLTNLSSILELPDYKRVRNHCLRIWFWNAPDTCFVVGINDIEKSVVFDITAFNIPKDSVIIHFQKFKISPVNGGERFSRLMRKLKPADMPTYDKSLIKKGFLTEMSTVQFELAKPNYYRYFEFLEPYFYRYIDSNSSTIDIFLSTLNRELGYNVYESYPRFFVDPKTVDP